MATNDLKWTETSSTTCISLTASVTNGNMAGGTTILDNSTNKYVWATATFNNPDAWGGVPTNNSTVDLYMVKHDVDGTSDETAAPTGTDPESADLVGSFKIYDANEEQRKTFVFSLLGVSSAHFYIRNNTGQTITYTSSPITVKIKPITVAPT